VKGLQELLDNLDGVNVSMRSAGRGAANAAAQVVKREAVKNARAQGLISTGALVNNIAVKRERGTPPTWHEYHVGVRHGREAKGAQKIAVRGSDGKIRFEYTDNPFYWHMWEFGHYNVFLRRHVAARAFMRPAMLSKEGELVEVMGVYLADRLERVIAKAIT
jgi:HK97 gp10 family phage protein